MNYFFNMLVFGLLVIILSIVISLFAFFSGDASATSEIEVLPLHTTITLPVSALD